MPEQYILIVDFGSQVTQLIARRVREHGVYSEIVPWNKAALRIGAQKPAGIILSGSHFSVHDKDAPGLPEEILNASVPVLGICYGMQLLCHSLGGTVEAGKKREFGRAFVHVDAGSRLTDALWGEGTSHQVWMSHGDHVKSLPSGFTRVAHSAEEAVAAIADDERKIYGLQFHPEVVHTVGGKALLRAFTRDICCMSGNWTMAAFRDRQIAAIRNQVGKGKVICGLSGGVDSAVAAVLVHEAIGDQLQCVLVDHGLLRLNEARNIVTLFSQHFHIPLSLINAQDQFLDALKGVIDPEKKRKIIGSLFIDVFSAEAKKFDDAAFLAQGTLYPDVIESTSFSGGPSVTIKSHHNVGGLPEKMHLMLVEPLRELFKDEVRELGRTLGLPEDFIDRHPFPGPGLAIRMPGAVQREGLEALRLADDIFLQEIRKAGLYDEIWQAFAVLLPVRTVGVMGDARTHEQVLALRAVTAVDGMTADFYPFDMNFLGRCAQRIINEVKGINRVVFDVTSKPPGTIEWE